MKATPGVSAFFMARALPASVFKLTSIHLSIVHNGSAAAGQSDSKTSGGIIQLVQQNYIIKLMAVKIIKGAPNISARAWFVLKAYHEAPSSLLVVVSREEDLASWLDAFNSLSGLLPQLPPFEVCLWGADRGLRAKAMSALYTPRDGKHYFHLASPEAIAEPLPEPGEYAALMFSFRQGWTYERSAALGLFVKAGYERVSFVEEKGQASSQKYNKTLKSAYSISLKH